MSPPLAVLNDEEMHWQSDLGLPNQRRWLNHRNIGDDNRRTFPSAAEIVTQNDLRSQISNFKMSDMLELVVTLETGVSDNDKLKHIEHLRSEI